MKPLHTGIRNDPQVFTSLLIQNWQTRSAAAGSQTKNSPTSSSWNINHIACVHIRSREGKKNNKRNEISDWCVLKCAAEKDARPHNRVRQYLFMSVTPFYVPTTVGCRCLQSEWSMFALHIYVCITSRMRFYGWYLRLPVFIIIARVGIASSLIASKLCIRRKIGRSNKNWDIKTNFKPTHNASSWRQN